MNVVQFQPRAKRTPSLTAIDEQAIVHIAAANAQLFEAIRLMIEAQKMDGTRAGTVDHLSAAMSELVVGIKKLKHDIAGTDKDDIAAAQTDF